MQNPRAKKTPLQENQIFEVTFVLSLMLMPGNVNHSLHAATEMQEPANPATLTFFPNVIPPTFSPGADYSRGDKRGGGELSNSRSSLIAFQDRTTPFVFP